MSSQPKHRCRPPDQLLLHVGSPSTSVLRILRDRRTQSNGLCNLVGLAGVVHYDGKKTLLLSVGNRAIIFGSANSISSVILVSSATGADYEPSTSRPKNKNRVSESKVTLTLAKQRKTSYEDEG